MQAVKQHQDHSREHRAAVTEAHLGRKKKASTQRRRNLALTHCHRMIWTSCLRSQARKIFLIDSLKPPACFISSEDFNTKIMQLNKWHAAIPVQVLQCVILPSLTPVNAVWWWQNSALLESTSAQRKQILHNYQGIFGCWVINIWPGCKH